MVTLTNVDGSQGYPESLLVQMLKIYNGVNGLIGILSVVLSGVQSNVAGLEQVYIEFKDCTQYVELPVRVLK
jgi:hypothetical protein